VIKGYKWTEAPVTKVYPLNRQVDYTMMKPFRDCWRISRPLFFLALRLRE